MAIEEQVRAYGGAQLQLTKQIMERFAQAIETSKVEIVPRVVVTSGAAGGSPGGGNAFESLLAALLSERLEMAESGPRDPQREATVQGLRSQLLTAMAAPEVANR
jgi:hypothetical protein